LAIAIDEELKLFTFDTDIMFVVRVPVLSLQITVVQPKVSTEGNDLTIAFRRAILLVPRAKHLFEQKVFKKPQLFVK